MSVEAGRTLLHYRIVEKLGEGGMGQVWRALDTSLDRPVAIKVLPEAFADDAERLARFEQEARLLASLNHPNIAAVYSVHAHDGLRFLAMELVEGEDLAHVLARGAVGRQDALEIAVQIAQALEAAHDSGVVHRDLKPANIALTPSGKVKVLDFGLAKAFGPSAEGDSSLSPTMTSARTAAGVILGTAGYMSPEQARGRSVDRRADVWAFGCVLYEMLTGRRAFDGETVTDTLAAVLKTEPDWSALPEGTPPAVRRVLRRCLTRDAAKRLGHVSGARVALQETLDGVVEAEPAAGLRTVAREAPAWKRFLPWALAGALAVVAGYALWRGAGGREPARLLSLTAAFPDGQMLPTDQMGIVALSPDGAHLALVLRQEGQQQLYLRRMDGDAMTPIAGTVGASTPVFSTDGRWIAFFADRKLKKVALDGGKPITLCEVEGDNRGASWGSDDRIVYAGHYTQALSRVAGAGGAPEALTTLDAEKAERTHRWPQSLPEHDVVLFTVGSMDSPESYDDSRIDALRLSSGERKTVLEGASMARYVPTGHLVFGRDGFLFAVPFDIESLETRGSAVPVVENVMGMRSSGVVHAEISTTGLLSYIAGAPRSRRSRLVWRYRDGRTEPLAAPPAGYTTPRLSPDRKRIVVPVAGDNSFDIWTWDVARSTSTRLTFEGDNTRAVWSPDGRSIAFASVRAGSRMRTYVKPADGSGVEKQLAYEPKPDWGTTEPIDWSPDGQTLLFEFSDTNQTNIMALDARGGEPSMLLHGPAAEGEPTLSPDGRWLAYSSDESGQPEIYVRPFPGLEGRWQISDSGGLVPRWSPDGGEIYYRNFNSLYAARITASEGRFEADRPQELFDDLPAATLEGGFDVFDRDRFLLVEPTEDEEAATGVTVVVNWLEDLRRRVPR